MKGFWMKVKKTRRLLTSTRSVSLQVLVRGGGGAGDVRPDSIVGVGLPIPLLVSTSTTTTPAKATLGQPELPSVAGPSSFAFASSARIINNNSIAILSSYVPSSASSLYPQATPSLCPPLMASSRHMASPALLSSSSSFVFYTAG
ncbi:hypothetical protein BDN72DRAFT_75067 [Pluteus cervinus]|uniref:Uncharacterized protein n=1 Tax=Pluteus cervinus TaxID=181527 RepID=A0ACD3AQ22_9AGAR|nr:hypothetical protein BDN72DRAFT_75067 [Pluteus cervinus]